MGLTIKCVCADLRPARSRLQCPRHEVVTIGAPVVAHPAALAPVPAGYDQQLSRARRGQALSHQLFMKLNTPSNLSQLRGLLLLQRILESGYLHTAVRTTCPRPDRGTYMGLLQLLESGVITHLATLVYLQLLGPLHTARIPAASHVSDTFPSVSRVPLSTATWCRYMMDT